MTIFLRLLSADDKKSALDRAVKCYRGGIASSEIITADVDDFSAIPGSPFSYWVGSSVRNLFRRLEPLEAQGRRAAIGLSTKYDARFVRAYGKWPTKKLEWITNGSTMPTEASTRSTMLTIMWLLTGVRSFVN